MTSSCTVYDGCVLVKNDKFIQKVAGALLKQGKARLPLKCSSLLHSRPPSLPHPTFNLLRALHRPQAQLEAAMRLGAT